MFSCKRQREREARPSAIASCNTLLDSAALRIEWSRPRRREVTGCKDPRGSREHPAIGAAARVALQVTCTADKLTGARNSTGGEAPRRYSTASEGDAASAAGLDELDSMDARERQPHQPERREANWPPRYNHLLLGGPVRARQPGISSIQARTPPRPQAREALNRAGGPRRTTPKPAPAITPQPARQRSRLSRNHLTCRAGRRSTTTPVTISSHDDAAGREQQLTRPLNSPLSVWPTYRC